MTQALTVQTPDQTFDYEALAAPIKEQDIKVRKGPGGMQLKYIKGSHAIETANRIFGFGCWGYKVVARGHQIIDDPKRGKVDMYMADVELSVVGNPFTFAGGGVGIVTEPFTVEMHEKAYKEAETDGMKRALRNYGAQFGLSLYDEDNYIEGVNGEAKQVKDVRTNSAGPAPAKVVEASPAPNALRLNELFEAGKLKAMWRNRRGMIRGVGDIFGTEAITSETIGLLDENQLDIIAEAIEKTPQF
jgi:hypothetical protein